ncbi:MAG TPA: multicopper oxidase domain-containing protein [Gemmatimonadales bacterium]|nr:multicopper oxidase domain-containing protein [Gemmatimonadales bacterium]
MLSLRLTLRQGAWFPDSSDGASTPLPAFAAGDGPLQIPGPLIRVPEGTEIRVRVENRLGKAATLHGLHTRPGTGDPVPLAPGAVREVRFAAGTPGTYYYWASTSGIPVQDRDGEDSQLAGAFVVDPAGAPPGDRIFVLGNWFAKGDTAARPVLPIREVMTINGRSWPHTERLEAVVGDSLRWRFINATNGSHPMHLHGVYFAVDSRGDWRQDTAYAPAERPLEVTELMLPGATMTMQWAAQRPGNWLMHCHFAFHVSPFTSLTRVLAGDTIHHGDHVADKAMAGLVLGVRVTAPPGYADPVDTVPPRDIRLLVQSRANHFGTAKGYGFVVQEGAEPARDSIRIPGTPLVLERGRPVRITVVNRLDEQTAVHWHGIELPSWPDGVPGWSGIGPRVMPPIAPGDSFVAEFTPPRAGTFIYHTHAHELEQMSQGLVGALLVVEPGTRPDPAREATLLVSADGPFSEHARGFVNGRHDPPPLVVPAGRPYRLRLINIHPDVRVRTRLVRDSVPLAWRRVATDGADLPASRAVDGPAEWLSGPGMTQDVEIRVARGERLMLELFAPFAETPWTLRVPVLGR